MSRRLLTTLLASTALALAACGDGGGSSAAPSEAPPASDTPASDAPATGACAPSTDAATVAVTIKDFSFGGEIQAAVGDVIGFTNEDTVPHTATLDDGTCTTENLGNGASGALTFSEAGSYPFHCKVHPDMKGTITITG